MFNWFKKGETKKTQETVTTEQLTQFCAQRGWQFFADREALAGFRDAEFWVPPSVSIAVAQVSEGAATTCQIIEDAGCDFVVGNEMAVRFCICTVERGEAPPILVYVARNWKKLPDMALVSAPGGTKGAPTALTNAKLARSYILESDDPTAANAQVTRGLESTLTGKGWCLLARGDWFTCHYNGRPHLEGIDKIIEQATQLLGTLPHNK